MFITEAVTPCKIHDADIWFTKQGTKRETRAKRLCGECPVRDACLASTMRFEARVGVQEDVVLGGLASHEREALLQPEVAAAASA